MSTMRRNADTWPWALTFTGLPVRGNNVRSLFAQPTTHHHRHRIVNLLHREMEFHPWQPRLIRLGMSVPVSGYAIIAMEHIQRDGH